MSRVLVVLKYGTPGSPQDQQRGPIYEPLFRAAGIDIEYVALYPMWAMGRAPASGRQTPTQRPVGARAALGLRRAWDTWNARRVVSAARGADAVLLVKTDAIVVVRALRHASRARLVYDLADTRRHDERESTAVDEIVANVDAITVDNDFARAYADRFGKPVHLFPPIAYVERFDERRAMSRRGRDGRVVLGWIGTPSTASNLYLALEALEDVSRRQPQVEVRLVGVNRGHDLLRRFEHSRVTTTASYDAFAMIDEVLAMDVGLFPQYDLEQAAMHGVTKALIYMAGGAAVVASPLPEPTKLLHDGENGFLASDRAGWSARLDALVRDTALRDRLSAAGLAAVRGEYSLARGFEHLRRALGV